MKRYVVTMLVATAAILFVAFTLVTVSRAAAGDFPDKVYYVDGGIAVSSPVSPTVFVDGVLITGTADYFGTPVLYMSGVPTGTHVIGATTTFTVTLVSLKPGEVYEEDGNGVRIQANSAEWGAVGIAIYEPDNEKVVYTISGWGYNFPAPVGTAWWDYDAEEWVYTQVAEFFSAIRVIQVLPPPPPPPIFKAYLPLVEKAPAPAECLSTMPFTPFYWQWPDVLGVCSDEKPPSYNGIEPHQAAGSSNFNWIYPGVVDGMVHTGGAFHGVFLDFRAISEDIGVYEFDTPHENMWIYSVQGTGFETIQHDWKDVLMYWNWNTLTWQETPYWSDYNILAVIDK